MRVRGSDWKWSCIGAAVLLGLATLLVFKMAHGFEKAFLWYLVLLPGVFLAGPISDIGTPIGPRTESVMFVSLLVCFNFIWYFVICFACIRLCRIISGSLGQSL
jgi:hypothetical protein